MTKIMRAMKTVIRAYDALIEKPAENISAWGNYGSWSTCHLCLACPPKNNDEGYDFDCTQCPLGPKRTACCTRTMDALQDALEEWEDCAYANEMKSQTAVVEAAKARRAWLIKKFNKFCIATGIGTTDRPTFSLPKKEIRND